MKLWNNKCNKNRQVKSKHNETQVRNEVKILVIGITYYDWLYFLINNYNFDTKLVKIMIPKHSHMPFLEKASHWFLGLEFNYLIL